MASNTCRVHVSDLLTLTFDLLNIGSLDFRMNRLLVCIGVLLLLFGYINWEKCRERLPRWKRPLITLATGLVLFSDWFLEYDIVFHKQRQTISRTFWASRSYDELGS